MSNASQYYQDRAGELFQYLPASEAYRRCRDGGLVHRNSTAGRQITGPIAAPNAPRSVNEQPAPLRGYPAAPPSASGQRNLSYTHQRRDTISSSNDSTTSVPPSAAMPIPQTRGSLHRPMTSNPAYAHAQSPSWSQSDLVTRMEATSLVSSSPGRIQYAQYPASRGEQLDGPGAANYYSPAPASPGGVSSPSMLPSMNEQSLVTARFQGNQPLEQLDPRYKRRPHDFFKVGRVFMVVFSEPASNEAVTQFSIDPAEFSRESKFGQRIHSRIRRFIVIREGGYYCNCVRIMTYGGQGVSKRNVNKSEHAIAYSRDPAPVAKHFEIPARGEAGPMRRSILIQSDEPGDTLDEMSRIDYGRTYTVEHNLIARAFGNVHLRWLPVFQSDFNQVYSSNSSLRAQQVASQQNSRGDVEST